MKTTVETLLITEITFPKVTLCPPKNTYTDLNYDLKRGENKNMDNDTRQELVNSAVVMLYDHLYDNMITNMSKLEESNRYYNWYLGYTEIKQPYIDAHLGFTYSVRTSANSDSISTQHFGDGFDVAKVDSGRLGYALYVYSPERVRNHTDVTLHLDVEKVSLKDLSTGGEELILDLNTEWKQQT